VGDVHPFLRHWKSDLKEKNGISYRLLWIDNFIVFSVFLPWESYLAEIPGLAIEMNLFAIKIF